jgi:hypothetical protein
LFPIAPERFIRGPEVRAGLLAAGGLMVVSLLYLRFRLARDLNRTRHRLYTVRRMALLS